MKHAKKQYEVLQWASLFLEKNNREPRVAELLLQHHLQIGRSEFFANMRDEVPSHIIEKFEGDVREHAETGKPVQHFTGYESFYGRDFEVNKNVLIPRPETEELIEHVLKVGKQLGIESPTIVDVGTGSGVIAITLAVEYSNATVYATDISSQALEVASKNAKEHHAKVNFLQGDFLQPLITNNIKADIIVSNPPYISEEESELLSDTVKNFDPSLALFADENGLAAYKQIIASAPHVLNRSGILAFEIGHEQGQAVSNLITRQFSNTETEVLKDINGKNRMVVSIINDNN
ncbi:peptide chain release factor N(5)-glutamine methyltransferase [Ornithinibacillus halophilus]|nr:peptide chain release factor N(5)-glutamine methyltransferase [Ornithinibacillus halophilus]